MDGGSSQHRRSACITDDHHNARDDERPIDYFHFQLLGKLPLAYLYQASVIINDTFERVNYNIQYFARFGCCLKTIQYVMLSYILFL